MQLWFRHFAIVSALALTVFTPLLFHFFDASLPSTVVASVVLAISYSFFCTWHLLLFQNRRAGAITAVACIWSLVILVVFSLSTLPDAAVAFVLRRSTALAAVASVTILLSSYVSSR